MRIAIEVTNDQDLVALDIPLRFAKPGDAIDLIRVDFAERVADWDVKHSEIDNQEKTVVVGLISSLAGDWENKRLEVGSKAEGSETIATLVFKTKNATEPVITTFETNDPGHALTFIYNQFEKGMPRVKQFTPEFVSSTALKVRVDALQFKLSENWPNPFNPSTSFNLTVPEPVDYSVRIFNALGQLVRSMNGHAGAGVHRMTWDGNNDQGAAVASGVYFLRVHAGTLEETRRMLLVR